MKLGWDFNGGRRELLRAQLALLQHGNKKAEAVLDGEEHWKVMPVPGPKRKGIPSRPRALSTQNNARTMEAQGCQDRSLRQKGSVGHHSHRT